MERLNESRASGVICPGGPRPPAGRVAFQAQLTAAARAQAAFIAASGRITHTDGNNTTPRARVEAVGLNPSSLSEIIYLQREGPDENAIRWWLASAVHCAALTDPRYIHVGASVTRGPHGTAYVVLLSGP